MIEHGYAGSPSTLFLPCCSGFLAPCFAAPSCLLNRRREAPHPTPPGGPFGPLPAPALGVALDTLFLSPCFVLMCRGGSI